MSAATVDVPVAPILTCPLHGKAPHLWRHGRMKCVGCLNIAPLLPLPADYQPGQEPF